MERISELVPDKVLSQIKTHISTKCARSEEGFLFLDQEEDAVTGALLENLRESDWQVVNTWWGGEVGRWKITHHKFGSRGKNAMEKQHGADGIFQIHIMDRAGRTIKRKGLLFQAKKGGGGIRDKSQFAKMESHAKRGSALFLYSDEGFYGQMSSDLLNNKPQGQRISQFLNEEFLACHVGLDELYFDYDERKLFLPKKQRVSMPFEDENGIDVAEIEVEVSQ